MLRINSGHSAAYCDGHTRRSFVQLGVAGMASAGLSQILAAKAASAEQGRSSKDTSVILLWLDGGPGHMDTYDMKPEMSAFEVTDKLVAAIESNKFDFILVNYANTDMVGHTGNFDAAVTAVEAVDACLGRVEAALAKVGGVMIITADHGNAEMMSDPATGQAHTAHTTNRVPIVLVDGPADITRIAPSGKLADVAPTILDLMGLPQPREMTGHSLLVKAPGRLDTVESVKA